MGTSRPHPVTLKPAHLKQLITGKREWSKPLAPDETGQGFKGWYASKHLPHFDAPGTRQFITYRLADAMPAARRSEWEAFLALADDLKNSARLSRIWTKVAANVICGIRALRT
jgi:hypothetical protein